MDVVEDRREAVGRFRVEQYCPEFLFDRIAADLQGTAAAPRLQVFLRDE
jgi:hypothetical protein